MGLSGLLADTDDGLAEAVARLATRPTLLANCNSTTVASPAEDWPIVVKSTVAEYRRAQQQATVR